MTRDENNRRGPRNTAAPGRATGPHRSERRADGAGDAAPVSKGERGRIAKLMARVGLCSRRDAESWILEGRVSLNGTVLTSPATDVGPGDQILVDGAPLPASEKTRLFLFHKPAGLITSDHDPEGRETVHDYLRRHWPEGPRVVTIGRLDFNTEGLLLLTNDGGLARLIELPKTGWVRRYRVRAKGETNQAVLDGLRDGVSVEGVDYAGIEAKLDRIQGANCWLTVGLREGKNREVKRVLEHIGLEVNRLIRLSFGPFQLLGLAEGGVEEVKTRVLREQLGPSLAEAAGVDFGEPEPTAAIVPPPARAARPGTARERSPRDSKVERPKFERPGTARAAPREGSFTRERPPQRGRPEEPPQPEKREKPVSGPRRHVSALRAAAGIERKGPRKRVERTDTTDRKNRTVTVERLVMRAAPTPASREARERRPRRSADDAPPSREKRGSQSAQGKRERIARSGAKRDEAVAAGRPPRRFADASRRDDRQPQRERGEASAGRRDVRSPRTDTDAPRSRPSAATSSGRSTSSRGRPRTPERDEPRPARVKSFGGDARAKGRADRDPKPGAARRIQTDKAKPSGDNGRRENFSRSKPSGKPQASKTGDRSRGARPAAAPGGRPPGGARPPRARH